jgi:hypothetical protein
MQMRRDRKKIAIEIIMKTHTHPPSESDRVTNRLFSSFQSKEKTPKEEGHISPQTVSPSLLSPFLKQP